MKRLYAFFQKFRPHSILIIFVIGVGICLGSCDQARKSATEPSEAELPKLQQLELDEEELPILTRRGPKVSIPQDASWHWQLNGRLRFPDRDVYDIDLFDTPKATISRLKRQGRIVVCYFSAGSWENWRPDASKFPKAAIGKRLDGWAGERWLDVRHPAVLLVMKRRLNLAVEKGCDGVEPDNVDAHQNNSGFPLKAGHLVTYNRKLVAAAHYRGLVIGLKNALDLIPRIGNIYDFALNEECYTYNECQALRRFVWRKKAVFIAEYSRKNSSWCRRAKREGFQLQFFRLKLNAVGNPC